MKTKVQLNAAGIIVLVITMTFLLTLLLLTRADAIAKLDEKEKEQTIVGTVVPVDSNDTGEVTAVAIQVVTETEAHDVENEEGAPQEETENYLVGDTEMGVELISLIGHQVEATGVIKIDEDDNKTILVKSFTRIGPDAEKRGSEKK